MAGDVRLLHVQTSAPMSSLEFHKTFHRVEVWPLYRRVPRVWSKYTSKGEPSGH